MPNGFFTRGHADNGYPLSFLSGPPISGQLPSTVTTTEELLLIFEEQDHPQCRFLAKNVDFMSLGGSASCSSCYWPYCLLRFLAKKCRFHKPKWFSFLLL
jgi:hypothetical protein